MRTINASDLTGPQLNVIRALIEAKENADDVTPAQRAVTRKWFQAAERQRIQSAYDEARRRETLLASAFPGNPYLQVEFSVWDRRERYLYRKSDWRRRRDLANDLRTDDGVPVVMKRRYQWANEAFHHGYLSAAAFYREALMFDQAVDEYRRLDHRKRWFQWDGQPVSNAWIRKQVRRLSHIALRDEYTDRDAWTFVHERVKETKERERTWAHEREMRQQQTRQWLALQQGRRTLADIRRHLRGQDRSPLPASTPAKTSPTS